MTFLETEKTEMERRYTRSPMRGGGSDVIDHVRSQIPLLSSSVVASPGGGHKMSASGEGAIKLKILEQENERLLRKIKGLEAQLQVHYSSQLIESFQEKRD